MRRSKKPLIIAACLSLLSLQMSGVHVHADDDGIIGVPETPFTHSHGHHDHDAAHDAGDYDDARDVSVLDLALGTFKMPLAILAVAILLAAVALISTSTSAEIAYPVLSGRHTRWRPPLRAPPKPA